MKILGARFRVLPLRIRAQISGAQDRMRSQVPPKLTIFSLLQNDFSMARLPTPAGEGMCLMYFAPSRPPEP